MNTPTKKILIITLVFASLFALILAMAKDIRWASGFLIAAIWSMANLFLTTSILEIATLKRSKKQLYTVLLLKFPFLYLLGLALLISNVFPLVSILAGMLPLLIISGVVRLWPKPA